MAVPVGAVYVPVLPNLAGFGPMLTAGLNKSMASATTAVGGLGRALGTAVPLGAAAAGLAIGAFAISSVKAAVSFDAAFTKIAAISNASAASIEEWKDQVLDLAGATAKAPEELADALFFLASAGLDANEVMPALEASAKAAAAGLGDTADVANIVASALNAYAGAGLTAATVTDTLVAAVREGRAEPEEFAAALGRILPIAANIGVTFDQVAASMAVLSNIGLDVNEAVTAMRGVMQAIAAPGTQAADAMTKLGLSVQDLLDAIAEDGIIGALRLLDQAAKQQTDTQAAYFGILRKVIPNVRALTGVLGLTGQEAEKVDAIFSNVLDSSGAMGDAFKTTAESDAFELKQALNDIKIVGQELAMETLPVLADALQVLVDIVNAAKAPFDNLQLSLDQLGLGFGAFSGPADETAARVEELERRWGAGAEAADTQAGAVRGLTDDLSQAGLRIYDASGALVEIVDNSGAATGAINDLGGAAEQTGKKLRDKLGKAAKEISSSLQEEIPGIIGTVTTIKDTFTITPAELVKITRSWAEIARRIGRDLRVIGNSDLKPAMREAISALPPEMRDAWVRGNATQRNAIEASIKDTYKVQDQIPGLARQALTGGMAVGRDMAEGIERGIEAGVNGITAAAAAAVNAGIAAARQAAQAKSPSKKMFLLGLDLMTGLQEGITDAQQKVIDAAQRVIDNVIKEMTADLDKIQGHLDRVLSKASELRGALRSGFDRFMDLSGGFTQQVADPDNPGQFITAGPTGESIAAFLASQVAQATQLADVLRALRAQGAGPELLSQIAQGGPEAIGFAQALLQQGPAGIAAVNDALGTIQELAGGVSQGITEKFFGDKIDELRGDVHDLTRSLRILEKPQRLIVEFRGNPDALRQYILEVLASSALARQSL